MPDPITPYTYPALGPTYEQRLADRMLCAILGGLMANYGDRVSSNTKLVQYANGLIDAALAERARRLGQPPK